MSDSIRKLDILRSFHKAQNAKSYDNIGEELKAIKTELQLANDLKYLGETSGTSAPGNITSNATQSPYLEDQPYYNKEVRYNSERETDWKQVRSEEDNRRAAFNFRNLKKLNII